MPLPQPDFHQIDVQRLIRGAQACGITNYQLVVKDRKLVLIVNEGDSERVEIDSGEDEIKEIDP